MKTRFVIQLTDTTAFVARYQRMQGEWARVSVAEHGGGFSHLPREATDLVPLGENVGSWLRAEFPDGLTCRLVIPASWCFIHSVDAAIGKKREQVALYEFEQFLPVDLDALTCVVQRTDEDTALAIGALTEPLSGLLAELERSRVFVEAIYVDALVLSDCGAPETEPGGSGIILLDAGHMTLTGFNSTSDGPTVVRSVVLSSESGSSAADHVVTAIDILPVSFRHWHVLDLGSGDEVCRVRDVVAEAGFGATCTFRAESAQRLLDAAATDGHEVDLRRDRLSFPGRWASVQRRLTACLATVLVLLVVIGFKFRIDNTVVARGIDALVPIRNEIYAQAFPGQTPPPEAALRLRSERIKLEGLTHQGDEKTEIRSGNGLQLFELMHEILNQLPDDLKIAISEILLDERALSFKGRTTSHGQAGKLVHALNQIPTISAEPPNTKLRKDQTVDFRINARVQRTPTND